MQTWGSAFIAVKVESCRVLWVHSLLVNLKYECENYSVRRGKQGHSVSQLSGLPEAF